MALVDTGGWLRSSRLWLCVTEGEIILLAAARRTYCERVAVTEARGSWYCHATGELVLEPTEELRFNRLALPPTAALRALACIEATDDEPFSAMENQRA